MVGHSVLNMVRIIDDDAFFNRFVDTTKRALGSPNNGDLRLAYHDMIQDFTAQKPLRESLTPADDS